MARHSRDDKRLVFDVPEAGALLGLGRNASYEAAKNGDIPTIRIGRLLKVPKAAFDRLLNLADLEQTQLGPSPRQPTNSVCRQFRGDPKTAPKQNAPVEVPSGAAVDDQNPPDKKTTRPHGQCARCRQMGGQMSTLEPHPLADLFPPMEGAEYAALREDIRVNGLFDPITLYQGRILDGRNRYRACQEAGVGIATVEFDPKNHGDPRVWVISRNLKRRHLNESQRAMIAAKLANLDRGRPEENPPIGGIRAKQASEMLNIGKRSIERARVVQSKAAPELKTAVEKGHVSVSAAADIAANPDR
jgi:excisionase family DNA binding protein